ncbi:MAG: catalase, partial [Alphaproteobacteria bacterium]
SVVWDEKQSPFVAVARLTVPAQLGWQHGRAADARRGRATG